MAATSTVLKRGSSVRRISGRRFVTGQATYTADLQFAGLLHAKMVRSPHAHARIVGVDASAAEEVPGFRYALTGGEAASLAGPIRHWIDPAAFGGRKAEVRCLAVEKAIYHGQPVAAVVADTPNDAARAAELVRIEWEPLAPVISIEDALSPDAPLVYESWDNNVVIEGEFVAGEVDAAFAAAARTVDGELSIQRYATSPLEPRGYIAFWNPREAQLTFTGTCQNPHPMRWALAQGLGLSEHQVRVVAPNIGGSFGLKQFGHPEEMTLCLLTKILGRPVRWIEDRSENLLIGGREQLHRFSVAFDEDGVISGLRNDIKANVGAMAATAGWGMTHLTALVFPTGYRIANVDLRYAAVTTNKGPWNSARGYGKEATNLVMERIVDLVAATLEADPAVVRRRNLIDRTQFPFKTPTGLNIDSGDYHTALDGTLDAVESHTFRARQHEERAAGVYLGLGIAFELTPEAADLPDTLVGGWDSSTVKVGPSGDVTVYTGVTSPGSGNETAIAQLVADELGVEVEEVIVRQGDTETCPYGFGNYSGRSMLVGGGSAVLAARDIRMKLATVAAAMLETGDEELEFSNGMISSGTTGAGLAIGDVAAQVYQSAFSTSAGVEPPLEATRAYRPENIDHIPDEHGRTQVYPSYSSAVHVAVVEVDPKTGLVAIRDYAVTHDSGTVINPAMVRGQMLGAVAMGLGGALSETSAYDAEGRLVADGFKQYLMMRASDMPPVKLIHQESPSPFTMFGNKGAGEIGVGGAKAAVANAVADALRPFGVKSITRMPLNPPNVLRMIVDAQ